MQLKEWRVTIPDSNVNISKEEKLYNLLKIYFMFSLFCETKIIGRSLLIRYPPGAEACCGTQEGSHSRKNRTQSPASFIHVLVL